MSGTALTEWVGNQGKEIAGELLGTHWRGMNWQATVKMI